VEELASSRWDGNLEIAVEGCIHSKKEEEDKLVSMVGKDLEVRETGDK
jgi:hypothetical protein